LPGETAWETLKETRKENGNCPGNSDTMESKDELFVREEGLRDISIRIKRSKVREREGLK
jgi:hypothetical protein